MTPPPYTVDRQRWAAMNIFEQMGNIYSEVGRSYNAKRQNKPDECEHAVVRALDLFDATVENLVLQKSPRTKEVLRAKDQYLETLYGSRTTPEELKAIDQYFMQFAIASRLNR